MDFKAKLITLVLCVAAVAGVWYYTGKNKQRAQEEVNAEVTKVVSFFGPPGCGKGTIAQRCVKDLGWSMLSTGDMCRQHIKDQTELGKQFEGFVKEGKLVPDQIITAMVVEWLKKYLAENKGKTLIIDGYPRTKEQAQMFVDALKAEKDFASIKLGVYNMDLDFEEIIRRVANRLTCSNKECQQVYSLIVKKPKVEGICDLCGASLIRRDDDKEEVIRERLKTFASYKDGLLNFYKEANVPLINFTVPQTTPDEVFEAFKKTL